MTLTLNSQGFEHAIYVKIYYLIIFMSTIMYVIVHEFLGQIAIYCLLEPHGAVVGLLGL